MHNNEQMIKPEQDSELEKPHLLLPLNRKRKNTKFAKYRNQTMQWTPRYRASSTFLFGRDGSTRPTNPLPFVPSDVDFCPIWPKMERNDPVPFRFALNLKVSWPSHAAVVDDWQSF